MKKVEFTKADLVDGWLAVPELKSTSVAAQVYDSSCNLIGAPSGFSAAADGSLTLFFPSLGDGSYTLILFD